MSRRDVLRFVGAGCTLTLVGACSDETDEVARRLPPRDVWMDPGPLRSRFTSVDGLEMHALVSTDTAPPHAPSMVLVHGSGLSGQYMVPTARELTPDFHVYVPDIPGYGNSGDPGEILDVPGMADWLDAWMTALSLEHAAFLGNSFGCQVIADLAARYPARVEHAVLQGPTTPPDERSGFWQFVRWRQNQAFNPGWLGDITNVDYRQAGFWRLVRSFMFQITDRVEDKVPHVQAPLLVIRGEHDPIAHQRFCNLIVELAPQGALHVIPDVAHTLVFVAPLPVASACRAFVLDGVA